MSDRYFFPFFICFGMLRSPRPQLCYRVSFIDSVQISYCQSTYLYINNKDMQINLSYRSFFSCQLDSHVVLSPSPHTNLFTVSHNLDNLYGVLERNKLNKRCYSCFLKSQHPEEYYLNFNNLLKERPPFLAL